MDDDLYEEMLEQERQDDRRYEQARARDPMRDMRRLPPDPVRAHDRYTKELAPVFETRRRIEQGLPATRNPLVNLFLKITGRDKLPVMAESEIIDPSKGLVIDGLTLDDAARAIQENPGAFRDLTRNPTPVAKVQARKKTVEDLRNGR